jgi:hypothetical protein
MRLQQARWSASMQDVLPACPDRDQLETAVQEIRRAKAGSADALAGLLLAVDKDGDADLLAHVEALLAATDARVWLALDAASRRTWWHAPLWSAAATRRLTDGDPHPVGLIVAALHPDGYVREAAVARLADLPAGPLTVPVLALRAADWVLPVRSRARLVLDHVFNDQTPAPLLASVPVGLAMAERRDGGWLADRIVAALRDGPPTMLDAAMGSGDRRTRRTAYQIAVDGRRLDLDRLVQAAVHEPDMPTRVLCAQAAIERAAETGQPGSIHWLLASRTAAVKCAAIRWLAETGELAPAEQALTDRRAAVRATAQWLLRRFGQDPAVTYRNLVAVGLPDPAALAGLGETGTVDDADLLRPWLSHPSARGRASAIRALRDIGITPPELLMTLLHDPAAAVTRQAATSILRQASVIDTSQLTPLLAPHRPAHQRSAAYRILHEHDLWTRLVVDLELIHDPDVKLAKRARSDLVTWIDCQAATAYASPPADRRTELDQLTRTATATLGSTRARQLRFYLGLR